MTAPMLINYYDKNLRSSGTWLSRSFYNGHIPNNGEVKEVPYLGVGLIRKDIIQRVVKRTITTLERQVKEIRV